MLSNGLKQRFCKDNKLSIQIFREPYFMDRLQLLGALDAYKEFENIIETRFNGDKEAFFSEYNAVKDRIVNFIKSSEAYEHLNTVDMNKFKCKYKFRQSNIYTEQNIGKRFISIDMKKANFSSLVHYGKTNNLTFFNTYEYDKFMQMFTDLEYIIKSKYIRQVVFGNCNPRRQIAYEKYIMDSLLDSLIVDGLITEHEVYSVCSDEIILDATHITDYQLEAIKNIVNKYDIPLKLEVFKLLKISNTEAYIKNMTENGLEPFNYELKCVNPFEAPFIYRFLRNEEVQDNDLYFMFNDILAKLQEVPELSILGS